MLATDTGDAPKKKTRPIRTMAGIVIDYGDVRQDVGQLQGAMKAQEDRSGRIEASIENLAHTTNMRFDGMKLHMDSQDTTLNQILINTAHREGAEDQKRITFDQSVGSWSKIAGIGTLVMSGGVLVGKGAWALVQYILALHVGQ